MRLHAKLKWSLAIAVTALAAGAAAQPQQGQPQQGQPSTVPFQSDPSMSSAQLESQADALIQGMVGAASQVGRRQLKAVADSDVVLALCLKDKLGQIDKAIVSAKERRPQLKNPDLGRHAFTIIVVQKGNADRAVREAAQCIGKDATTAGETKVTTLIDNTLPADEGNGNDFPAIDPPGVIVVAPPPPASPSR